MSQFDFYFRCIDSVNAPETHKAPARNHTSALQNNRLHLELLLSGNHEDPLVDVQAASGAVEGQAARATYPCSSAVYHLISYEQ